MLKRAYIEITNVCNLRCTFCPGTRRAGRFLPPEAFRELAEKLRGHVSYVYLHVMGEPLLHPRLEEILEIAAGLGLRVCITTNGTLLGERAPLLLASPAVNIASESQMYALLDSFPVPVMHPLSGSGLTFVSGTSYDTAFEDGFARIVAVKYMNAAGQEMTVESIYPARALSLMGKGDYRLSGVAGQSLAGMRSVRMENATSIRLHAQAEEALYVVTVPKMESSELIALTRSLQLFEGE